MTELIIISKTELEKILRNFVNEIVEKASSNSTNRDERLNQKEAAEYLGITQSTLIRWKKKGLVPCEQLQGSTKVTYYKSQLKSIIQRNPGLLEATRK